MNGNTHSIKAGELKLVIVMPLYNDWDAAACCLQLLDSECIKSGLKPAVLLVNDGSGAPPPDNFLAWHSRAFVSFEILNLYRNLGHQRAICIGLAHVCLNFADSAVLVMDADGEDPPERIISLIEAYLEAGQQSVIFAARRRRTEGFLFTTFYHLYRAVHLILVGFDIRIGNFSILPPPVVARLVRSSDLWNHYAASVVKAKLPWSAVPIDRGKRLKGQGSMNLAALVLHGLSAMSVYTDIIGVRILMFTGVSLLLGLCILAAVVVIRFFTSWAIPGWAADVFALTLVLMFQIVAVCLLFTFGVLASRSGPTFIPIRDCPYLVSDIERLVVEHA